MPEHGFRNRLRIAQESQNHDTSPVRLTDEELFSRPYVQDLIARLAKYEEIHGHEEPDDHDPPRDRKQYWRQRYRTLRRAAVAARPCGWCGALLDEERRPDTLYCDDVCRKLARRQRRYALRVVGGFTH